MHVAHICCRRGGGASGLSGKDRCRALHAEPSHPVPQIVGNNQKNYQTTKPLQTDRNPKAGASVGLCVRGKRRGGSVRGVCLRAVPAATGTRGGMPKPGPTRPCTHTALAHQLCVSCASRTWGRWLSFEAGRAAQGSEAAGRLGGSAPLKHIWRERAMRREKAEEGQGWDKG